MNKEQIIEILLEKWLDLITYEEAAEVANKICNSLVSEDKSTPIKNSNRSLAYIYGQGQEKLDKVLNDNKPKQTE